MSRNGFYCGGVISRLLPDGVELLPNTNQLWEIDMAYGELQSLKSNAERVKRSAFFARVDGNETYHYRICRASPLQVDKTSSIRRQTFFDVNQFKTAYATHGLFPYRGKFHPQLVKAILNVIAVKSGETVLDPMAGSGTLCIEAAINGIHSVGVDVSPFCAMMMRAKTQALSANVTSLRSQLMTAINEIDGLEARFPREGLFDSPCGATKDGTPGEIDGDHREIVLLCYLDAMGYAARRVSKTARELLPVIEHRYLDAIERFQKIRDELDLQLGQVDVRVGDARSLDLPDESVHGIITSPPYSFAIDYADNDRPQLEYLGQNVEELKTRMVGLIGGKSVASRVKRYFEDMRVVFAEMYRVLKRGRCCVVVIGSNEIQTGGIRHEVEFDRFAREVGFKLFWNMVRPIEGIRNSMRDEYVMFFQKV